MGCTAGTVRQSRLATTLGGRQRIQNSSSCQNSIPKQVEHGVFGYSIAPEHYFDTFNNWQRHRHHIDLKPEWLRFDTGVVNSIYAMVNWLTKPGDAVLIMEPVYYPFINAIKDNNRELVSVDLKLTQEGWQIDFEKFEATVRTGKIKLFILCSPHNPVGRIWSEQELDHILDVCRRYGVRVVADEIHQDFEVGTQKFQSVLTVAGDKYQDDVIVLNAPSKTFNLAALLNSHVIIPNSDLRADYDAYIKTIHQTELSILGLVAGQAAYESGGPWLDNLLQVISYNYNLVKSRLAEACPEIEVAKLEGNYLTYINLAPLVSANGLQEFVQDKCGLAVDYGKWFSPQTATYIRLNLATSPKIVERAVNQLTAQLIRLR